MITQSFNYMGRYWSHPVDNTKPPNLYGIHRAVLNQLNTSVPYGNGEMYYPLDSFRNAKAWDNTPVYFQNLGRACKHPSHNRVSTYMEDAMGDEGVCCGYLQNSMIYDSHTDAPKLVSSVYITNALAEEYIQSGKMQLSSAFDCAVYNNRLVGNVKPSHVLLFMPGPAGCVQRDTNARLYDSFLQAQNLQETNAPFDNLTSPGVWL